MPAEPASGYRDATHANNLLRSVSLNHRGGDDSESSHRAPGNPALSRSCPTPSLRPLPSRTCQTVRTCLSDPSPGWNRCANLGVPRPHACQCCCASSRPLG